MFGVIEIDGGRVEGGVTGVGNVAVERRVVVAAVVAVEVIVLGAVVGDAAEDALDEGNLERVEIGGVFLVGPLELHATSLFCLCCCRCHGQPIHVGEQIQIVALEERKGERQDGRGRRKGPDGGQQPVALLSNQNLFYHLLPHQNIGRSSEFSPQHFKFLISHSPSSSSSPSTHTHESPGLEPKLSSY